MLEQLLDLVREQGRTDIIENPAIPNDRNEEALGLATDSVIGGLKGVLANGGLKDVLGMFAGQSSPADNQNGIVSGITGDMVSKLTDRLGLDSGEAGRIATSLIPGILGKLVSRTNDPNDAGFDMNGIIGALTGGGTAHAAGGVDFGGIVKQLSNGGLDANGDGSLGMDDLSGMISKAAGGQGGGLGGLLGGLFGKS